MTAPTAEASALHGSTTRVVRDIDRPALLLITVASVAAVGVAVSLDVLIGVGVLLGLAAFIAFVRRPVLAGYAVAALVPVTSGLARDIPVPGFRVSELLVVVSAVAVLGFAKREESPRFGAVDWALLAYGMFSVLLPALQLIVHDRQFAVASFGSLLLPFQFFLIYRTVRTALPNADERIMAVRLLLGSSVAVCCLAVLQQLDVGPSRRLAIQLTDSDALQGYAYEFFARATGPFQHWHPLAGYLVVILLLCIALLLDDDQRVAPRRVLVAITALAGAALMLSVTFTSMFAVILGAVALGIWSGRTRQTVMWCGAGALASVALFGSFLESRLAAQFAGDRLIPETVGTRFRVWLEDYLPAMAGNWAGGYGVGLPPDITWTHTESAYITVLLRGGIPLLAIYVVAHVLLTAKAIAGRANSLVAAFAAVMAVSWIMNLLYPYATSSGMAQPLWVLAGIAAGTAVRPRAPDAPEPKKVDE